MILVLRIYIFILFCWGLDIEFLNIQFKKIGSLYNG